MVATPFKGYIKAVPVNAQGKPVGPVTQIKFAGSDVAAAAITFGEGGDSRQNFPAVPGAAGWAIIDIVYNSAGADCTNDDLYMNNKLVVNVVRGSNGPTTIGRQFQGGAAILLKPGNLQMLQRA